MSATGNETTLKVTHQVLRGMSSISSRAALARLSEETYPSRRGTPLMQEPPPPPEAEWEDDDWEDEDEWEDDDWEEDYWEDDDWEDDDWEEPWEEPEFENVTIASVTWPGNDDWERAIYKLSNGYSAFASKGLAVGQTPFDYEELRAQGGGYYNAPAGTVGHVFTRNGGALIIKEGSTFKQQQYGWGNQGPVFAASKQDVTSQIGKIEEMSNSDIDGDGEIGVVEPDELEVEVDSALYDNPDGDMSDRAIYRMSDGSVFFAEQGLEKGDVPMEGDKLSAKKGDVKVDGLSGAYWSRNGIAIVYSNNGVVTQQGYKWANNGLRESGKLRVIKNKKQVIQLEERLSEDLNDDGAIGEGDAAEIEVRSVIYENQNGDFERSIYKMSDDSVYFAEPGLEKGDLPMEGDALHKKDGSPIETKGLSGLMGMRNGMAILYYNDGVLTQQGFKWSNRGLRESGRLRNVTKQLDKIEERLMEDINGDQMIGGQMDEDAEVKSVVFGARSDDGFDRSLYEMDNGAFILAEPGLIPGDLPFEPDSLSGSDGKPYDASKAVGLMGMRNGFAMILREDEKDKFSMQMFKWGGRGPRAKGRIRDITRRIFDTEDRAGSDFTDDGIIGKPHSGKGDPEISRVIFPGNEKYDEGLYQMQDGSLVFAEPDLDPGDTPFEDTVIFGKNGQPYQTPNVVGIYPIRSGFSLVQVDDTGKYVEQGFKDGRRGLMAFGKMRKIKNIEKLEKRIQFDINNDQKIAGQQGGGSGDESFNGPSARLIDPIDLNALSDPLA